MLLFAESICRIFFLLSPRVSLHLDGFGRVLCQLSGFGMVQLQLKGGQVSTDRKACHWPTYAGLLSGAARLSVATYDIQPKLDLCADTFWGDSGYLGITFHLLLPTFLHSICAAETLNRWFLSNCEMSPFWTRIFVYKWLTSRDVDQHQGMLIYLNSYCVSSDHLEIRPELTMDYPMDNTFDKVRLRIW